MLNVISLFSGVGGLDFGFEMAGFRTAVSVEIDRAACSTLKLNRDWPVMQGDINSISSRSILRRAELTAGNVDVLIGGPPCQPFSKAGYWNRGDALRLDDPRASTLSAYLRVLRDVRPRAFLLENVGGLAFRGKDEGLRLILDGVEQINRETGTSYQVTWAKLNAADYGVPQFRERVFVVASRDGREFKMPATTHGEGPSSDDLEPYRTAWDAIGDLEVFPDDPSLAMGGKWADLLPSIPEGRNYLWHSSAGGGKHLFGRRTRYWSFLLKLAKDRPSWTIQASPGSAIGPFHWNNRKLSAIELCRLQTLPDGILFDCGRTDVQRMLGNAVPSLLAEVLACEIKRQLLDVCGRRRKLRLLPPRRDPTPPAARVSRVPAKFLHLVGHHEDHPGEGRGRGARSRAA